MEDIKKQSWGVQWKWGMPGIKDLWKTLEKVEVKYGMVHAKGKAIKESPF